MKEKDLFQISAKSARSYRKIPKFSSLYQRPLLYRVASSAKMALEGFPVASIGVRRFLHRKHPSVEKYVTRSHRVVIDGYPRSANSYSRVRFLLDNPDLKPVFGNHIHLPSQIILAVKYSIPTVLLVRNPRDAVLSFTALQMQGRKDLGSDSENAFQSQIRINFKYYQRFHQSVLPVLDSVVVAPFEKVIHSYENVIEELNEKFGTSFVASVQEPDSRIFEASPEHLSPSASRNELKQQMERIITKAPFAALLEDCNMSFRKVLSFAKVEP